MGKIRFSFSGLNLRYPYPVCKKQISNPVFIGGFCAYVIPVSTKILCSGSYTVKVQKF